MPTFVQRIPETPPKIAALANSVPRILWSVMIPAFNCSRYLSETIESVLAQDLGPSVMQIEVVDDCSTDADVEKLVKIVGKGRVTYYRQSENVGSLRNFETCINRSRGLYIHLLHGDDKIKPGFYGNITSLFDRFPQAGAAFCAWEYINEHSEVIKCSKLESDKEGILVNCFDTITKGQITQYVSTVVRREVYEKLGSFFGVQYGEDWIMWARIAKSYPVIYTPQIFAQYREHNKSISGLSFLNGDNLNDIKKVSEIISSYLPVKDQNRTKKELLRNYTYWMLDNVYELWSKTKDKYIVYNKLMQLVKGYKDIYILNRIFKLIFLMLRNTRGGL